MKHAYDRGAQAFDCNDTSPAEEAPRLGDDQQQSTATAPATDICECGEIVGADATPVTAPHQNPEQQKIEPTQPPKEPRPPRVDLLSHQLQLVARSGNVAQELGRKLRKGTVDTYNSLSPSDALDSIVARNLVGLSNLSMEVLGQAGIGGHSVELRLKYAPKLLKVLSEYVQLYDSRHPERRKARQKPESDPVGAPAKENDRQGSAVGTAGEKIPLPADSEGDDM